MGWIPLHGAGGSDRTELFSLLGAVSLWRTPPPRQAPAGEPFFYGEGEAHPSLRGVWMRHLRRFQEREFV